MEQYKEEFIEFMVESNVLKFGDFTLKSGRKSPFFMNAGAYVTGSQLRRLGQYYAKAIHDHYGDDFDVLFGPAYKGDKMTALDEIRETYGFKTGAIVTMEDVVEKLYNKECQGKIIIDDAMKASIDAYYEQYGVK